MQPEIGQAKRLRRSWCLSDRSQLALATRQKHFDRVPTVRHVTQPIHCFRHRLRTADPAQRRRRRRRHVAKDVVVS